MVTGQNRWWEYMWARLGRRRLTPLEWKTLEGLIREVARGRFKIRQPTALHMLLAACDVLKQYDSTDELVHQVRLAARHVKAARALPAADGPGSSATHRIV